MAMYDAHSDGVFAYCHGRVQDRQKAKFLTEKTYQHAWHHISNDYEIQDPEIFLYNTATEIMMQETNHKKSAFKAIYHGVAAFFNF